VRTDEDIHKTPRFRNKNHELRGRNTESQELPESYFQQLKWQTYWFIVKLLPNYRYSGGRNVENQIESTIETHGPELPFVYSKVKPGKDYFSGNFFPLMILLVYELAFHKRMTEIQYNEAKKTQFNLSTAMNHFSTI
jgi:hypothetical protein